MWRMALRWLVRVGMLLGVLVLLAWGLATWIAVREGDLAVDVAARVAFEAGSSAIWCGLVGCPAEPIEGLVVANWDGGLLPSTPVALAVDPAGRVYVAESDRQSQGVEDNRFRAFWLDDDLAARTIEDRRAYIEKWLAAGRFEDPDHFTAKADRLVRYEDADRDGVADRRRVLSEHADPLDGIGAGVLVEGPELWYTNIPNLWHLRDDDGDGAVEVREALHTGFGVKTSLGGHDLHGLVWGPDHKLYFSVGDRGYAVTTQEGRRLEPSLGPGRGAVFRMNPDGSELEVFAEGLRNPQELAFDDYGNLFTADNNGDGGDEARLVYVVEGGDSGWAMPYQSLVSPYIRGPWVAERLWEPHHASQPAWIVPPIATLARGPAGFAAYPGTGLPARYAGHFLLADYRYQVSQSGIWSFGVEPRGAGFALADLHPFLWSILATDLAFGPDGQILVSTFDQFGGGQSLEVARHEVAGTDPRVAEVAQLLRDGLAERSADTLSSLLGHPDRRIRLRAQWALADRGALERLAATLRDGQAPLLARVHALWGITQAGPASLEASVLGDIDFLRAAPDELRAQLAKSVGDRAATGFAPTLLAWLDDPAPRVRFFAAQSLGALGHRPAVAPLLALLRANDDTDPYLRHAAVYALHRIGAVDDVYAHRADPSRAVRLGVLLVLRRAADARVAVFLEDADPLLVVEAARAIYDVPIPSAMPALAGLEGEAIPLRGDDAQSSQALHRRILGARLWLGTSRAASQLAAYAAHLENPKAMRMLALDLLETYPKPAPRDLTMSFWRPRPARRPEIVHAALDRWGPALLETDLGDRALEVALAHGRVPLDDAQLVARVADHALADDGRVAALRALAARNSEDTGAAARAALGAGPSSLRVAAREVLAESDPDRVIASLRSLDDAASVVERQQAFALAATLPGAGAEAFIAQGMDDLLEGRLDPALQLDVLEAARARGGPLVGRLARWEARFAADDLIGPRRVALEGGEVVRGRALYQTTGDCLRCHATGDGHGGAVGPDLAGVVARRGRDYVLESVIDPQAEIADGFGTLAVTLMDGRRLAGTLLEADDRRIVLQVGDERVALTQADIVERSEPTSGMPPVGLALDLADLRDLMAYLATL